jgi:hypothetical protein
MVLPNTRLLDVCAFQYVICSWGKRVIHSVLSAVLNFTACNPFYPVFQNIHYNYDLVLGGIQGGLGSMKTATWLMSSWMKLSQKAQSTTTQAQSEGSRWNITRNRLLQRWGSMSLLLTATSAIAWNTKGNCGGCDQVWAHMQSWALLHQCALSRGRRTQERS